MSAEILLLLSPPDHLHLCQRAPSYHRRLKIRRLPKVLWRQQCLDCLCLHLGEIVAGAPQPTRVLCFWLPELLVPPVKIPWTFQNGEGCVSLLPYPPLLLGHQPLPCELQPHWTWGPDYSLLHVQFIYLECSSSHCLFNSRYILELLLPHGTHQTPSLDEPLGYMHSCLTSYLIFIGGIVWLMAASNSLVGL